MLTKSKTQILPLNQCPKQEEECLIQFEQSDQVKFIKVEEVFFELESTEK